VSAELTEIPPPTEAELAALRGLVVSTSHPAGAPPTSMPLAVSLAPPASPSPLTSPAAGVGE